MYTQKVGIDFIKHFPNIETVSFSNGGLSRGFETTVVHFSDGQAVFTEGIDCWSPNSRALYSGITKDEFLSALQSLHIEDWYKHYMDMRVLDENQWDLEIRFNDGHKMLIIHGSNYYPPNFQDLQQLMSYRMHTAQRIS